MKFIGKVETKGFNLDGDLLITLSVKSKSVSDEVKALPIGTEYSIDVKDINKRNLRQNAYLWQLIGQISKKLSQDDETTYLTLLKAAKAKFEYIGAIPQALPTLKEVFRVVELVDERDNMNVYRCYYGSSKMTKKEFNELLELTISWCYELDIEPEIYR